MLKRCVSALRAAQRAAAAAAAGAPARERPPRVPFYDSKLTQLLEPALGGPSRTAVVVCASQEPEHAEETVGTLRFAEACRLVERAERADAVSAAARAAVAAIDREIAAVEEDIKAKERWETRTTRRTLTVNAMDTGATELDRAAQMDLGGFGAVTIARDDGNATLLEAESEVTGQVLVGAEAERARLEALLEKRRRLLGGAGTVTAA